MLIYTADSSILLAIYNEFTTHSVPNDFNQLNLKDYAVKMLEILSQFELTKPVNYLELWFDTVISYPTTNLIDFLDTSVRKTALFSAKFLGSWP